MKQPKNIFLVGPMGAGKSAVGRYVARALHMSFVDSDDEIESRTGVDISFIFEKEGEAGFRKREAVGRGFVVYLYTSVDQQVARTHKGRDRPLLQNSDPRATLQELLDFRDPLYREIADAIVETDGRKVKSVAEEIIEQVS